MGKLAGASSKPSSGVNSGAARGARASSAVHAGRSIVSAPPPRARGPSRGSSRADVASDGHRAAGGRAAGNGLAADLRSTPHAPPVATTTITATLPGPQLDVELRGAVLKVFEWCDADGDGLLNGPEFATAQRLIAEVCPGDFNERAANAAFEKAGSGSTGAVGEAHFFAVMQQLVDSLQLPHRELVQNIQRQTSKRSSQFDRSVSDMKQALVRNVSNLPDDPDAGAPAPLELWRTVTGRNAFRVPAGAAAGPLAAQVAFKVMQYLAMRTEDATAIHGDLVGAMMGHRQMFKHMLDMTGEIHGAHVITPGPGLVTVDLFIAKSLHADQLFRVRVTGMQLKLEPAPQLIRLGGFEPTAIGPTEVPPALWEEMQGNHAGGSMPGLSALGVGPPQPTRLVRQVSVCSDADLQNLDLALVATPVARHTFRVQFGLAVDGHAVPAPGYLVLVPRLRALDSGRACYADHRVTVACGSGAQPQVSSFGRFLVASVRGRSLPGLVVEHAYTNCRVRVQPRSSADISDIVPVPELLPEERANSLAVDSPQASLLQKLLTAQGLARRPDERDIAFAMRLGRSLGNDGYKYDVAATDAHVKDLPLLIWEQRRGDCSAFSAGFVYALRAFGVPAHVSLGFKYGRAVQQACGSAVAPHAQAEFFAEGIGWVPCDVTLGIKRLGHDGSSQLSFVEWRPAAMSLAEAEELAQVMRSPADVLANRERLRQRLEEHGGGGRMLADDLASGLEHAEGLTRDAAHGRVGQVMRACGYARDAAVSAEEFARGAAAFELGRFRELGAGDGLTSTSTAGVKFYEGGPYKGTPLNTQQLRENMMVQDGIEQVVAHVGGGREAPDWSRMWPHGVLRCRYEFDERALP